jgi:transcription elongation factor GreA
LAGLARVKAQPSGAPGSRPDKARPDRQPHPATDRYNVTWGSSSQSMNDIKKKLQDEISTLEYELHVELPKEILKARAHGDLSENAEYHAAKDRQGFVNARLGQLRKRLAEVAMIDFTKIPHDRVGLGSTVVVLDVKRDEEITYNLVTSEEADAANGKISTTSPIGRALLGKEEGDSVRVQSPGGVKELEIRKLTTIHDATE